MITNVKQVNRDAYDFMRYGDVARFASYHYQLAEIFAVNPKSVLEVGVGDGVVGNYLRTNTNISYTSLDIAEDVHPDIQGSITSIPLPDDSVEVACAFEVLEHLPFSEFEKCLLELSRVASKKVIISIPHFGPPVQCYIKVPFIKIRFAFKIPYPATHLFNGQHYWEVGKKGYTPTFVRRTLKNNFVIEKEFVPFENQYHHFYILRPKDV